MQKFILKTIKMMHILWLKYSEKMHIDYSRKNMI
jgi:hypothetical protein